jgi:hypothetical protein
LAVIEQKPASTRVTELPDTVQMAVVVDVKETGKPELAVANIEKGANPNGRLLSAPKVMV